MANSAPSTRAGPSSTRVTSRVGLLDGRDVVHLMFTEFACGETLSMDTREEHARGRTLTSHPVVVDRSPSRSSGFRRARSVGARARRARDATSSSATRSVAATSTSRGGSPTGGRPRGTTSPSSAPTSPRRSPCWSCSRSRWSCSRSGGAVAAVRAAGREPCAWRRACTSIATYFVSRNRPAVPRLEDLIVADSYPVGPHRGVGRALRVARDRRVVAHPQPLVARRSPSPSPSSRRSSSPRPGCTAACTTRPT